MPARTTSLAIACCIALLAAAGCGPRGESHFTPDMEDRLASEVSIPQREAIDRTMFEWFGTGDAPTSPREFATDQALLNKAAGPSGRDLDGNVRGVYRTYCATCHGVSGDGAGPLATTFDPYPRDFRTSTYKYTSTNADGRATRDDLRRTIREGLEATGMPAFPSLSDDEVNALVEYLRYLGVRGETERYLAMTVIDEQERLPLSAKTKQRVLDEIVTDWSVYNWDLAENDPTAYVLSPQEPKPLTGEALADSIGRGRETYLSENAQCVSCHGEEGRGDGDTTDVFDEWNKPKNGMNEKDTARRAERFTLPIQQLRPRDFRQGVYRGGDSYTDLHRRLHAGIKGTPMPGAGAVGDIPAVLTDEEIHDLINYVRSLER